jgi:eukaryotic-like serine/threonine-protein kinase
MHEVYETLSPGAVIGDRYLVVDLLGKGGFSAVYLVKDLQGQQDSFFALKEASRDREMSSEHFAFECRLLQRLSHPALPRVHEVFEDQERTCLYMLMDYVEGPNLETLRHIQHEQRFSLQAIMPILAPVVEAIGYLHQQEPPIVHRDIKPSNMIVPVVEKQTVLVDFGIAKEYDTQGTTSAVRYGSHGYGAPEQYSAGTNTRTDIYGLGATLYTLLTGEVPVDALERMTRLSNEQPDPLKPASELNPALPAHASRAIEQAMSITMRQRFATVQQFWLAVQGEPGEPVQAQGVQGEPGEPVQATLAPEASSAPGVSPSAYALSGSTGQAPVHQLSVKQESGARARKSWLLPIVLLAVLLVGVAASYAGVNVFRQKQVVTPTTPASGHHALTPNARATVTATAATKPKSYPPLATSYRGNIDDLQANVPSSMELTGISQNGGTISGTFIGLHMKGTFQGTLDTAKHISFFVASSAGHGQLSFTGALQTDGELQGQFCAIDQNSQCIPYGVFGLWSVSPARVNMSGSSFPQTALDMEALTHRGTG